MNDQDFAGILEDYVQTAIQHGKATDDGDSNLANNAYDHLDELFQEILVSERRRELLPLLDHEDPSVRSKAAFHTLTIEPTLAEAALEAVAAGPGLIGFSAEITLSQWRLGKLKAP